MKPKTAAIEASLGVILSPLERSIGCKSLGNKVDRVFEGNVNAGQELKLHKPPFLAYII